LSASASGIQLKTEVKYMDNYNTTWHVADGFVISSGWFYANMMDQTSWAYTSGQRFTWQWSWIFLKSDQYGEFNSNWWIVFSVKTPSIPACGGITYWLSGNLLLTSPEWGNLTINSATSYFCPNDQTFLLDASGTSLGTIRVEWGGGWELFVFDNARIQISGATSTTETSAANSEYTSLSWAVQQQGNFVKVDAKMDANLLSLNATINRNIINMTKGRTPSSWNSLSSLGVDSFNYYKYDTAWTVSNSVNYGQILTLWTPSAVTSVTGENTLVVQSWNLYIRNDISNANENSVLTIIVKRDSTHKNRW
jgi:hypothetical protein